MFRKLITNNILKERLRQELEGANYLSGTVNGAGLSMVLKARGGRGLLSEWELLLVSIC